MGKEGRRKRKRVSGEMVGRGRHLTYQETIKSIGVLIGSKLLACMIRRRGPPHSHHAPSQQLHFIEPMRAHKCNTQ